MHYQVAPCAEAKLVRCTRGAICDVIIDLRRESATHEQYVSEVLSSDNYKSLFIPEGFAHGFQTLEDNSEVFYQMSEFIRLSTSAAYVTTTPHSKSIGPLM
jgi:dTDP-4-dehydrorhamnose 3,5-epimerase